MHNSDIATLRAPSSHFSINSDSSFQDTDSYILSSSLEALNQYQQNMTEDNYADGFDGFNEILATMPQSTHTNRVRDAMYTVESIHEFKRSGSEDADICLALSDLALSTVQDLEDTLDQTCAQVPVLGGTSTTTSYSSTSSSNSSNSSLVLLAMMVTSLMLRVAYDSTNVLQSVATNQYSEVAEDLSEYISFLELMSAMYQAVYTSRYTTDTDDSNYAEKTNTIVSFTDTKFFWPYLTEAGYTNTYDNGIELNTPDGVQDGVCLGDSVPDFMQPFLITGSDGNAYITQWGLNASLAQISNEVQTMSPTTDLSSTFGANTSSNATLNSSTLTSMETALQTTQTNCSAVISAITTIISQISQIVSTITSIFSTINGIVQGISNKL